METENILDERYRLCGGGRTKESQGFITNLSGLTFSIQVLLWRPNHTSYETQVSQSDR